MDMNYWIELDRTVTLFINGNHSPLSDSFFYLFSKVNVWIPFYLSLLYIFYKQQGSRIWVLLLAVGVAVLLADQVSSGILKPLVGRLRPSHDPDIQHMVHLVRDYRGALYGFVSSHAANTAAIATLFILLIRRSLIIPVLVLWTTLSSCSRIFLGLHYLGDILAGSLVGIAAGFAAYAFYRLVNRKMSVKYPLYGSELALTDAELFIPTFIWLISGLIMFVVSVVQHA